MYMYFYSEDAGKIYYRKVGKGQPIVMLHPVGLNSEYWRTQEEVFSEKYTVISIDFRGYGKSEKPSKPFQLKDLARDVVALCKHLELNSIIVCGQSLGGMVAQIIAIEWPKLVSGLILANTTSRGDTQVMQKRASIVETGGMIAEVDDTLKRWFTQETIQNNKPLINKIKERLLANDPQVHGWTWRAIGDFDVMDRIHTIQVPCLVIVGDRDMSTPPEASKEIVQRISGAKYYEIPDTAHMAFLEKPDVFTNAVKNYLSGMPGYAD